MTRIGPGTFVVDVGGRREVIYVAGPPGDRWAFWNGHVFRAAKPHGPARPRTAEQQGRSTPALVAPMPGTVVRVMVTEGARVTKGDLVVILEAMKMELPVRAMDDGTIVAVRCREGELVQADQVLVEITA